MLYAQEVVGLGHGLRKEHKLKVRQPLQRAYVICANPEILNALRLKTHLIADELNVKEIVFEADETPFVLSVAKPNFRVLGKKVGKLMPLAQGAIADLSQAKLHALFKGETCEIVLEGQKVELTAEDVSVERKVKEGLVAATSLEITIALDTALNEELLLEGLAREIINKINTMRRDLGFAVTDRIVVELGATDRLRKAFDLHRDFIMHEVLATQVLFACSEGVQWDLNGEPATIAVSLSVYGS